MTNVFDLFPRTAGESACAYASRQAAIGGWQSVPSFARSLGLVWTRLVTGDDLGKAAAAFGEPEAAVAFDSGRSNAESVALRGQILSRRQWSGTKPLRFCPGCLRDDVRHGARRAPTVWHRTWWDVAALGTCTIHRSHLASACTCGAEVLRTAPFDGRCPSCRSFLGDVRVDLAAEGGAPEGTLYVAGRLGASVRLVCPVLDPYPLKDAIAAMVAVGRALQIQDAEFCVDAGFPAFSRWPRSFDAALDAAASSAGGRVGRWGAAKAYGPLHAWITGHVDEPLASRMGQRMAAHADRNGVSPGRTVGGRRCGSGDTVTLAELSAMTRLSHAKASRLAKTHPETHIDGKGRPAVVAMELARSLGGSVGLTEIAAALGVGRGTARDIVAAGLLAPLEDGGVRARRAFRPEAAAALVERAAASLLPAIGETMPLPVACRDMQVAAARALAAVLAGTVRGSVTQTGIGLASLAVMPSDLRPRGRLVDAAGLTVADVARGLGVKWEVARALVDGGLVARDPRGALTEHSVAEFGEVYVAASDVAAALGTSPRALLARGRGEGIEPAIGPPACRQAFFERSAVERLRAHVSR